MLRGGVLLAAYAATASALDLLQLRTISPFTSQQFQVISAAVGEELQRVSWQTSKYSHVTGQLEVQQATATPEQNLQLIKAKPTEDCTSFQSVHTGKLTNTALLLDRSARCSVQQQAVAAEQAGVSLVVIRDTIAGAFNEVNLAQSGSYYDCALGEEAVTANSSAFPELDDPLAAWTCTLKPQCATNACVLTGKTTSRQKFQACCFTSNWLQMQHREVMEQTTTRTAIPVVLVAFQDGKRIDTVLDTVGEENVRVWAFDPEENPWNASMFVTWLLGVITVMGAAYRSCSEERQLSYEKVARILSGTLGRSPSSSEISTIVDSTAEADGYVSMDDDRLELSSRHAVYFLVGASSFLVLLYYVHLALVLSVLFAVGASAALAHVFTLPLVAWLASPSSSMLQSFLLFLATLVAPAIGLFWFLERNQPWIWPIQDFMALMICVVFIDVVRLPNLRVATILLLTAFVYDIFFVYISPLVFGSNVMIDVAAGGGGMQLSAQAADTRQFNPQPMPMVLSVPLTFSVYGGEALLGLGDIIIPGLLVAFCIRYDYSCGHPISRGYFIVAASAYAVGLMAASVMAVVLRFVVAGQPALMYVVPTMLLAVLGFATINEDLADMWDDPACFRRQYTCHAAVLEEAEREVERQGEQRPLLAE